MSNRGPLTICSDKHDEVAYVSYSCPVCVVKEELKTCEKELAETEIELVNLDKKFADYEADYIKWKEVVDTLEQRDYGTK